LILFVIYGYISVEAEMTSSTAGYNYSTGQTLFEVILTAGQELFGAVLVLALGLFTIGALWSAPVEFIVEHLGFGVSYGIVLAGRTISAFLAVIFFIINWVEINQV